MASFLRLAVLGIVTIFASLGTSWAHDGACQINAAVKMLVAGGLFIWTLRRTGRGGPASLNRLRAFS